MGRLIRFLICLLPLLLIVTECSRTPTGQPPSRADYAPRLELRDEAGRVVLSDKQVAEYQWATHTVRLQPGANLDVWIREGKSVVHGAPFSVVVDGETCYQGVVTSTFSSIIQTCPVIIPHAFDAEPGTFRIELGYPMPTEEPLHDPRDNERVKAVLQDLGKLRE